MSDAAAATKAALFDHIGECLDDRASAPALRWFVPGRIEVLGKHTDYAGGRSLVCAVERGLCVAAVPRDDATIRIVDCGRSVVCETALRPDLDVPQAGWTVYASVVARRVARNFAGPLRGADIAFASDLPSAAGMSSSSALVIAIFGVLSAVNHLPDRQAYAANIRTGEDLAAYLGCVENGQTFGSLEGDAGVGTFGGSEDHAAILGARAGELAQYAFCPVRLERRVALARDHVFAVAVSGVVADKIGSARVRYNRASQAARTILDTWRAASGSHATTLAEAAHESSDAPERIRAVLRDSDDNGWLFNRFEHFLRESEHIVPAAVDALDARDFCGFGELVDDSQRAAEQLLGNQVPETAWLAREARTLGAIAASSFGAGFGGSVWALVPASEASSFIDRWRAGYGRTEYQSRKRAAFFVSAAGPPATTLVSM